MSGALTYHGRWAVACCLRKSSGSPLRIISERTQNQIWRNHDELAARFHEDRWSFWPRIVA